MTDIGKPQEWRRYEPIEEPSHAPAPQEEPEKVSPTPQEVPSEVGEPIPA